MTPPAPKWTRARVTHRIEWATGLFTLRFDVVPTEFRAGQFIAVRLDDDPPPGSPKAVQRLFSLASAPGEPIELFVVEVEGGELSPRLTDLRVGDGAWVTPKAKGVFTLARVPDAEVLWLISTGTGLAPFVSMLRTEEPFERFGRIVVIHGVRHTADLAYGEELRARSAARDGRVTLIPTVTREDPGPAGLAGRIPALLEAGRLEEAADADLRADASQVMLCGNPAMIRETTALLQDRGFRDRTKDDPGNLHYERYW